MEVAVQKTWASDPLNLLPGVILHLSEKDLGCTIQFSPPGQKLTASFLFQRDSSHRGDFFDIGSPVLFSTVTLRSDDTTLGSLLFDDQVALSTHIYRPFADADALPPSLLLKEANARIGFAPSADGLLDLSPGQLFRASLESGAPTSLDTMLDMVEENLAAKASLLSSALSEDGLSQEEADRLALALGSCRASLQSLKVGPVHLAIECSFAPPNFWGKVVNTHLNCLETRHELSRASLLFGVDLSTTPENLLLLNDLNFRLNESEQFDHTNGASVMEDCLPTSSYNPHSRTFFHGGQVRFALAHLDSTRSSRLGLTPEAIASTLSARTVGENPPPPSPLPRGDHHLPRQ